MNNKQFASYLREQDLARLKKIAPIYQKSILKSIFYKILNAKLRQSK